MFTFIPPGFTQDKAAGVHPLKNEHYVGKCPTCWLKSLNVYNPNQFDKFKQVKKKKEEAHFTPKCCWENLRCLCDGLCEQWLWDHIPILYLIDLV